jgi:hypothetical protein
MHAADMQKLLNRAYKLGFDRGVSHATGVIQRVMDRKEKDAAPADTQRDAASGAQV